MPSILLDAVDVVLACLALDIRRIAGTLVRVVLGEAIAFRALVVGVVEDAPRIRGVIRAGSVRHKGVEENRIARPGFKRRIIRASP